MTSQRAAFDTLRSLGFASISGTFAAVGTQLTHIARLVCLSNNTDGDMFFSIDGTNNQIFVAAGGFKLFDFSANNEVNASFYLPALTQFYVKQSSAPTKGSVYIDVVYGVGE